MFNRMLSVMAAILFAAFGARAQGTGVLMHHNDWQRDGSYTVPGLTLATAPSLHRDTSFNGTITGAVYAQPLYWLPTGAKTGEIIVATETNDIYALDAEGGSVIWHINLGAPVPLSDLPCGDINPEGVTGTPVIQASSGTLFLEAAILQGSTITRQVFGISLASGKVLPGWPVDVSKGLGVIGTSFNAPAENQRGALTILGNEVFVAYGGNLGDCSTYNGVVVGLSITTPAVMSAWQTRADKGGIWAPGGISQADAEMFVATGNESGASTWSDSEAIIRLQTSLAHSSNTADYYAPSNWQAMDSADQDMASTNPVPFVLGTQKVIMGFAKNGYAYLLNRLNLGGIGGQMLQTQVSSKAIKTAPTQYLGNGGEMVIVGTSGGLGCPSNELGMLGLVVTPTAIKKSWCAAFSGNGSPMNTTSDGHSDRIVWAAAGGDLYGWNGLTGALVSTVSGIGAISSFITPMAAEGHIYVAGTNKVYAFTP